MSFILPYKHKKPPVIKTSGKAIGFFGVTTAYTGNTNRLHFFEIIKVLLKRRLHV